jgi:uncharacterized protein involved in propanediol utilization
MAGMKVSREACAGREADENDEGLVFVRSIVPVNKGLLGSTLELVAELVTYHRFQARQL